MPWAFSASDAKTWHYPGSVCRVTSEWAKSWHFPCSVWRPTSALLTVRSLVLIQQRASIFYGASLKMHLYRKAVFHCPHCFGSTYHCSTVPNSPIPFSSYFIRHYPDALTSLYACRGQSVPRMSRRQSFHRLENFVPERSAMEVSKFKGEEKFQHYLREGVLAYR